jgi:Protein of unknown function (DUF4230)
MSRFWPPIIALALLFAGLVWWTDRKPDATPETIAGASLTGIREQNRLSAFAASYTAVVTSEQRRFGLSAKKTLIMQGLVRYEVDLATLSDDDVRWDAPTKTLSVRVPPIEVAPPQIDLKTMQEYGESGILRTLTNADAVLDSANREQGQVELLRQARGPVPMKLARDAFKRTIAQNFEVPLRAAGIDAKVTAFFADEQGGNFTTRWDISKPIGSALGQEIN